VTPSTAIALPPAPYRLDAGQSPAALPLVVDSPHSWPHWPSEVTTAATPADIQTSCDAFVDELWRFACQTRAPVLSAGFHRALIDANRARDDITPSLLADTWPSPLKPTQYSRKGFGLIREYALPSVLMYHNKLSAADVQARLTQFYEPYHRALANLIDACQQQFGACLHLNCHSMKSVGNAMNDDQGLPRPDMVVSDLDGATAHPRLTRWIAQCLSDLGYRVQINDPYKGAALIAQHSDLPRQRYSIQIEINRALYLDEKNVSKHAGYAALERNLRRFVDELSVKLLPTLTQLHDTPCPTPC
jgi:N-formylglutamate deformylase